MIERLNATFDAVEFDPDHGGHNQDIIRVVVTNEKGEKAIAFLSAVISSGRVRFELIAKKHRGIETAKKATADWLL